MSTASHPVPWRVQHSYRSYVVLDTNGVVVACCAFKAQADRIANAMNAHEAMLDALRACLGSLIDPDRLQARFDARKLAHDAIALAQSYCAPCANTVRHTHDNKRDPEQV